MTLFVLKLLLVAEAGALSLHTAAPRRASVSMTEKGEDVLMSRYGVPSCDLTVSRRSAVLGLAAVLPVLGMNEMAYAADGMFSVPPLPYAYDALEPTIDAATMKFHHDFHHQAYVTNLNKAMAGKDAASLVSLMPQAKANKLNNAVRAVGGLIASGRHAKLGAARARRQPARLARSPARTSRPPAPLGNGPRRHAPTIPDPLFPTRRHPGTRVRRAAATTTTASSGTRWAPRRAARPAARSQRRSTPPSAPSTSSRPSLARRPPACSALAGRGSRSPRTAP